MSKARVQTIKQEMAARKRRAPVQANPLSGGRGRARPQDSPHKRGPERPGTQDPAAAAARLQELSALRPVLALVLGSGFGHAITNLQTDVRVPYSALPGFPPTTVAGHSGEVLIGRLANTPVLVLNGRSHFYEGHAMSIVTFAVRVLAAYGITDLLLTNAAGGVKRTFHPGDFMVLSDHINFMGTNPLRGPEWPGLQRFVDLTAAYDSGLRKLLHRAAKECGTRLHSGVYLAVSGPSYETPAEIRAFARLGADAVGMSTVPEVVVARQCGLRVAGLSCITNAAAGNGPGELSHVEVLQTAEKVKAEAARFLGAFARLYGSS